MAARRKKKSGGDVDSDEGVKMGFKMFNFDGGDSNELDIDMGDISKMFGGKLQDVMKQALKKGSAGSTFTINTDGIDVDIDNILSSVGSVSDQSMRKADGDTAERQVSGVVVTPDGSNLFDGEV